MKKTIGRLAMLILTVCMIVCMIPNVSFNASAALADHANHCICGGGVTAGGHQCSDFAEWKPLDLTDTVTWINGYQTQVSGSYYLTEDIVLDENDAGLEFHSEQEPITVNICLNGHKIKRIAGDGMSCLSVQPESTVNICDCGGSGEIINETSHAIANQGTLNFYSGAAYSSGQYKAAILCTVNDQVKNSGSTCNFYGGKLDSNGETVRLRDGAVFTVEDGTISGTCPIRLDGGTCEIKGGSLISKGKYCISVNDTLAYPPTDPPTVLAAARLYISGTPTLEGESTANIYLDTVPAETAADAPIISCSRSGKAYAGDELSISLGKTSQAPGYLIGGEFFQ